MPAWRRLGTTVRGYEGGSGGQGTRSIRIRQELQRTSERDAAAKGISVKALVSSILTQYLEWGRFTEKIGYVNRTGHGYRSMLEAIPDDQLASPPE